MDKERLEDQVVKQMEVINRQTEELTNLKDVLADKEAALTSSQVENLELLLKSSISKSHRIMFDDPWIVETTHHRCKGEVPSDREGQMLLALPGASADRPLDAEEDGLCAVSAAEDSLVVLVSPLTFPARLHFGPLEGHHIVAVLRMHIVPHRVGGHIDGRMCIQGQTKPHLSDTALQQRTGIVSHILHCSIQLGIDAPADGVVRSCCRAGLSVCACQYACRQAGYGWGSRED
jgi:hypothetical protein